VRECNRSASSQSVPESVCNRSRTESCSSSKSVVVGRLKTRDVEDLVRECKL
jgi:hypothetical protein